MSTNEQGGWRIIPVGEELPLAEPSGPSANSKPKSDRRQRQRQPAGKKARAQGRFAQINAFCDQTLADLERAELAVWLLLWRETRPNGTARVAQSDLARRAGCAARTVRRALVKLQELGLVEITYQGGWPQRLSVYRVRSVVQAKPES